MQSFEQKFKKFGGSADTQQTPTQQKNLFDSEMVSPQSPQQTFTPQPTVEQHAIVEEPKREPELPSGSKSVSVSTLKKDVATSIGEKGITDSILSSIDSLVKNASLVIPSGYNVANELKIAYYQISNVDGVNACTPMSIANAITETAIQGLSASKKQCYYIKYGNTIQMQRSYFGDIALVKMTGLVKDVYAIVIYEGDEIETGFDEYGMECVVKHKTKFGNQDNAIIGAYAVAVGINGYKRYCIMTKRQLDNNFKLSKSRDSKFQKDFPEEASKRTAIRRLVKMILNTAVDTTEFQNQIIGSYERTLETEYEDSDTSSKETADFKETVKRFGNAVTVEDDL